MHQSDQEKSAQETSEESQSVTLSQVQFGSRKEESTKKANVRVVCQREVHGRQRRVAKTTAKAL